jgi:hypothetical protein
MRGTRNTYIILISNILESGNLTDQEEEGILIIRWILGDRSRERDRVQWRTLVLVVLNLRILFAENQLSNET